MLEGYTLYIKKKKSKEERRLAWNAYMRYYYHNVIKPKKKNTSVKGE